MSNRRKLAPRPPDASEAAFRDALARGCPECGSRKVTGRFNGCVWAFTLCCLPSCPTFGNPQRAHAVAAEAVRRAGLMTGEPLVYMAVDNGAADASGEVAGVVRARG